MSYRFPKIQNKFFYKDSENIKKIHPIFIRTSFIALISFYIFIFFIFSMNRSHAEQIIPVTSGLKKTSKDLSEEKANALIDPHYGKVSHSEIYRQANEVISFQIDYINKKLNYIIAISKEKNDLEQMNDKNKKNQIERFEEELSDVLGPFCSSNDDIDECTQLYSQMTQYWLLKARRSLGDNQTAIAQLAPHEDQKESPPTIQLVYKEEGDLFKTEEGNNGIPKEKVIAPYFAKGQQLAKLSHANSQTFKNKKEWAEIITGTHPSASPDQNKKLISSLEPHLEDFIQFEERKLNPEDPNSEWIEAPKMQGKNPVYDTAAFEKAKKSWEIFKTKLIGKSLNSQDFSDSLQKERENFKNDFRNPAQAGKNVSPNSRLFINTRGENVQIINTAASKKPVMEPVSPLNSLATKEKNFSPQEKNKNKKVIKVSISAPAGGYTGNEEVDVSTIEKQNGNDKQTRISKTWHAGQIDVSGDSSKKPSPPLEDEEERYHLDFD